MLAGPYSESNRRDFRHSTDPIGRLMVCLCVFVISGDIALSQMARNVAPHKTPDPDLDVNREASSTADSSPTNAFRIPGIESWKPITNYKPLAETKRSAPSNAAPDQTSRAKDLTERPAASSLPPSSTTTQKSSPSTVAPASTSSFTTRAAGSSFPKPIAFDSAGRARLPNASAPLSPQGNTPIVTRQVESTPQPRRLYLPAAKSGVVQSHVSRTSHTQDGRQESSPDDDMVAYPNALAPEIGEPLSPGTSGSVHLPLVGEIDAGEMEFSQDQDGVLLTFKCDDHSLREVLGMLAASQGLNLICSVDATSKINGNFHSITFDDAMDTIVGVSGHHWMRRNNVIIVTSLTNELKLSPEVQGRKVRVFTLNYVSASDVQKACTGLMSPSGTMVSTESDPKNSQKTREQLMVEDLPAYLDRISELICQMDIQPLQVLIEAHILQVDLKNNRNNGVDFAKLGSIAGTDILVGTPGFNGAMTGLNSFATPSYNIGIFNAGNFSGLIEALQKTTDAKTLASPKVLALNGQEAHVQIGKRLGYHVTTTTQTSTLQSVQFLDTGVVLTVTPRITADNQIMLTVKPEVSDGSIDALGLPSTTTTEVETNIMLPDGKGMVIGGLIKETDITQQQKVPFLGSLWMIGKLFRKNSVTRERSEIIIALVPHIVGGPHFDACQEDVEIQRAASPLFYGPLDQAPRPWEPKLPDATDNPHRLDRRRASKFMRNPTDGPPRNLEYYFPADGINSSDTMIFESIPVYQSEVFPPEYAPQPAYPVENHSYE